MRSGDWQSAVTSRIRPAASLSSSAALVAAIRASLAWTESSIVRVARRAVVAVRIAQGTKAMIRNQKSSRPTIERLVVLSIRGGRTELMGRSPAGVRTVQPVGGGPSLFGAIP